MQNGKEKGKLIRKINRSNYLMNQKSKEKGQDKTPTVLVVDDKTTNF